MYDKNLQKKKAKQAETDGNEKKNSRPSNDLCT
jgi:hypothetical protein